MKLRFHHDGGNEHWHDEDDNDRIYTRKEIQILKSALICRLDVLARAIYETPEGGTGCCLHVVLDDGNFERRHVEYCLSYAKHGVCREVAELLLHLTDKGREQAVGDRFLNFLGVQESEIQLDTQV